MEVDIQSKENYLWIVQNSKKCPKCGSRIEKSNGCDNMFCILCHYGFCWWCFQNYFVHKKNICDKLKREANEKNKQLCDNFKSLLQKDRLRKELTDFWQKQKQKENSFLTNFEINLCFDRIEHFRKIQEIEEFLFFTAKIPFVFPSNLNDIKQLRDEREYILNELNSKNEHLKLENYLKKYVKFIERKLGELRKLQKDFNMICNI